MVKAKSNPGLTQFCQLSLNPTKCAFRVTSEALLGHIVSKEGIAMDPDKVKLVLQVVAPTNSKTLS